MITVICIYLMIGIFLTKRLQLQINCFVDVIAYIVTAIFAPMTTLYAMIMGVLAALRPNV